MVELSSPTTPHSLSSLSSDLAYFDTFERVKIREDLQSTRWVVFRGHQGFDTASSLTAWLIDWFSGIRPPVKQIGRLMPDQQRYHSECWTKIAMEGPHVALLHRDGIRVMPVLVL